MITQLKWQGKLYEANLAKPISISLPIKDGDENPNCYFAEPIKFEVIKGDGFIGSIKLGGVVNHQKLTISPHGNGTHTECYGHITDSEALIATQLQVYFHIAQLITVSPAAINGDLVIDKSTLENKTLKAGIKALVIRTLPNSSGKLQQNYSGTNPTYFSQEAMQYIVAHGIDHLITDLPSVDKEQDEGKLLAHKTFWQINAVIRKNATITELAFIDSSIEDAIYLLDLQILPLHLDASPSNPIFYSLNPITS